MFWFQLQSFNWESQIKLYRGSYSLRSSISDLPQPSQTQGLLQRASPGPANSKNLARTRACPDPLRSPRRFNTHFSSEFNRRRTSPTPAFPTSALLKLWVTEMTTIFAPSPVIENQSLPMH
ncbi:hypothetical protein B0H19DRAFT_1073524 [Mycena capillaripes]|nr:hypothetical protein B0H19DRAFT_1073524 [Mycena capillaripes]